MARPIVESLRRPPSQTDGPARGYPVVGSGSDSKLSVWEKVWLNSNIRRAVFNPRRIRDLRPQCNKLLSEWTKYAKGPSKPPNGGDGIRFSANVNVKILSPPFGGFEGRFFRARNPAGWRQWQEDRHPLRGWIKAGTPGKSDAPRSAMAANLQAAIPLVQWLGHTEAR